MGEETLEKLSHAIGDEIAHITRRVEAPSRFTHTIMRSNNVRFPAEVTLHCAWNKRSRKYEIEQLELKPLPNGEPITSQLLRKVPVGAVLESASKTHLAMHARIRTPKGLMSTTRALEYAVDHGAGLMGLGPRSAIAIQWVATIHELAAIEGRKPTQAVSEVFNISLRTASNWVKAARESGTLDDG